METMCPSEGHHPFSNEACGSTFVKCDRGDDDKRMEGTMYRCPMGYSYWRVSRRCERTDKLTNCAESLKLSHRLMDASSGIPVEWINLGKARQLRF